MPETPPRDRPHEVLLVEDQPLDILWITDLIDERGYTVELVGNEADARRLLLEERRTRRFRLAIIDISVPTMGLEDLIAIDDDFFAHSLESGLRLCRFLRQDLGLGAVELPVLCLSARNPSEIASGLEELKSLDVAFFRRIPSEAPRLSRMLERLLPLPRR